MYNCGDAAFSHRRRVTRPGARRHTSKGLPAGLPIDPDAITADLRRRQGGYGRGRRMEIETDTRRDPLRRAQGRDARRPDRPAHPQPRLGRTGRTRCTSAPSRRQTRPGAKRAPVTRPRPGHADLAGALKYERDDMRDILERASARETTARVAAGALARQLLAALRRSRSSATSSRSARSARRPARAGRTSTAIAQALPDDSPLHCVDPEVEARDDRGHRRGARRRRHARRRLRGDRPRRAARPRQPRAVGSQARWTAGAGDHVDPGDQGGRHRPRPARRRSARLAGARRDRPAAPRGAARSRDLGVARPTNRAGGLEGGITNGEDVCASPAT